MSRKKLDEFYRTLDKGVERFATKETILQERKVDELRHEFVGASIVGQRLFAEFFLCGNVVVHLFAVGLFDCRNRTD